MNAGKQTADEDMPAPTHGGNDGFEVIIASFQLVLTKHVAEEFRGNKA